MNPRSLLLRAWQLFYRDMAQRPDCDHGQIMEDVGMTDDEIAVAALFGAGEMSISEVSKHMEITAGDVIQIAQSCRGKLRGASWNLKTRTDNPDPG